MALCTIRITSTRIHIFFITPCWSTYGRDEVNLLQHAAVANAEFCEPPIGFRFLRNSNGIWWLDREHTRRNIGCQLQYKYRNKLFTLCVRMRLWGRLRTEAVGGKSCYGVLLRPAKDEKKALE